MVGSTADRLLALRNNQKRMHGHLPPPLLDARGRMLPEEIQKRTTTSQANKLLRLGRDHEILVEVSRSVPEVCDLCDCWSPRSGLSTRDPHLITFCSI
jgi:hypothetical protein